MKINGSTHILSLQDIVRKSGKQLEQSIHKVSSSSNIPTASYDPSGTAIVSRMQTQVNLAGLEKQILADNKSALTIAEAGMQSIHETLFDLRQLGIKASNSTLNDLDRQTLNHEKDQLISQIDSVVGSSIFNGSSLLDDSTTEITLGVNNSGQRSISLGDFSSNTMALVPSVTTETTSTQIIGGPVDTPVKIDSEFALASSAQGDQKNVQLASLTDGKFVAVWQTTDEDGSGYAVKGQIFNADQTKSGGEFRINTYTDSDQSNPQITSLDNGGFAVVWTSSDQANNTYTYPNVPDWAFTSAVYMNVFDSNGAPSGEIQISSSANGQRQPDIEDIGNGRFAVAWNSYGQDGSRSFDPSEGVYLRLFNYSGVALTSDLAVQTDRNNGQNNPTISTLSNDDFLITYYSSSIGSKFLGQQFNYSGIKVGTTEFEIANPAGGPILAITSGSNDYLVYRDSGSVVYAQYNPTTQTIGTLGQISPSEHTTGNPSVIAGENGEFLVSWSARGGTDGSGTGIYAQRVDASFNAIGDVILVNSTTSSDQANPSIIKLDDRDYVVGWSSEGQDGDGSGIYAQVISTETRDETITDTVTTVTGGIDFSTSDLAKTSISTIDSEIERLMENRVQVGVGLNAVDHSLNIINQKFVNTQKAASQIGDVDMASQISKLSANKLLQDVGLTMLSKTAGLKNELINVVRSAML